MFTLGILTSSDTGMQGQREDTSGKAIKEILLPMDFCLVRYEVVPDEEDIISKKIKEWADSGEVDLIVTTGGTGFGPRDVTPEATLAVLQRHVPGIPEAMRQAGLRHTPMAILIRGTAGLRGNCLIINLPGSPNAVKECLAAIMDTIPHAIETMKRARTDTHPTS